MRKKERLEIRAWKKKKVEKRVDFAPAFWYNSLLSGDSCLMRMRYANVAQSVEQRFRKPQVKGSSPFIGSMSRCSAVW